MKIMIYDKSKAELQKRALKSSGECQLICTDSKIHTCVGCSDCWTRMPGECPIHDSLGYLPQRLSETDELYILCECVYGCVAPFVKTVIDRMMGYLTPIMENRDGDMRFRTRYIGRFRLTVCLYNDVPQEEQRVVIDYVTRLGKMLNTSGTQVYFLTKDEEIREVLP